LRVCACAGDVRRAEGEDEVQEKEEAEEGIGLPARWRSSAPAL
jgi:hypothetical protein